MFISRLCKLCNNDSNTISLITTLLSRWSKDEIGNLFTQMENNNIYGNKLHTIFVNECNGDHMILFTLDYSKFDDTYFMDKELNGLSL